MTRSAKALNNFVGALPFNLLPLELFKLVPRVGNLF